MSSQITAVHSALGLLAFWVFIYVFWSDYRIDAFRDHVFSIRQKLFVYAESGGVSFDDPAYTVLRGRMNLLLRYGHEFTLSRLFLTVVHPRATKNREQLRWEAALKALPSEETRQALEGLNRTLSVAIVQLMIYRSFFCYLLIRPFLPTVRIEAVLRSNRNVASSVARLQSRTLDEVEDPSARDNLVAV